jgi:hypothetical protein
MPDTSTPLAQKMKEVLQGQLDLRLSQRSRPMLSGATTTL